MIFIKSFNVEKYNSLFEKTEAFDEFITELKHIIGVHTKMEIRMTHNVKTETTTIESEQLLPMFKSIFKTDAMSFKGKLFSLSVEDETLFKVMIEDVTDPEDKKTFKIKAIYE